MCGLPFSFPLLAFGLCAIFKTQKAFAEQLTMSMAVFRLDSEDAWEPKKLIKSGTVARGVQNVEAKIDISGTRMVCIQALHGEEGMVVWMVAMGSQLLRRSVTTHTTTSSFR